MLPSLLTEWIKSSLVDIPSNLRLSSPNLNDPLVSSVHKIYIVQCPEIWLRSVSSGLDFDLVMYANGFFLIAQLLKSSYFTLATSYFNV